MGMEPQDGVAKSDVQRAWPEIASLAAGPLAHWRDIFRDSSLSLLGTDQDADLWLIRVSSPWQLDHLRGRHDRETVTETLRLLLQGRTGRQTRLVFSDGQREFKP